MCLHSCLCITCDALPTFNADFNHKGVHRVWNKKVPASVIKIPTCFPYPGRFPQVLYTGWTAFRAVSPQSYPQARLRVSVAVHSVNVSHPDNTRNPEVRLRVHR